MLKKLNAGDKIAGVSFALIGAITLLASAGISKGAGGLLHPRTFPVILGGISLLLGSGLALRGFRTASQDSPDIDWPDREGWQNWGLILGMIIIYVALMRPVGFLLMTFLFILVAINYFGKYRFWVGLACAAGTTIFIYVTFVALLGLPFPEGILEFIR